ncbi:MAG: beta-glucosidase [Anaerolineae bacterium]|nr:beta-glucosidase [Anaerolineae bacterium]
MTSHMQRNIKSLLAQMTLDEKLAQMGSCWVYELQCGGKLDAQKVAVKLQHGIGQISRVGGASTLHPAAAAKAANEIQKFLVERTRLSIPAILHEECCSGAMVLGGSMFPQIIGLACSFQPELAEEMSGEIRRQLRAIGAHQGLAPMLDICRDPRWGRVEESFGEDALLASQFGIRYIRGLQGNSLRDGIMATGKHFIGHSLSEGGLNCSPVRIGWHDLWDVHLMPFQAAIRCAGLAAVMNAYPSLDGEVVAASQRILTELLRQTLGFDGLLVSDYEAIQMIHTYHRAAPDRASAAAMALRAGIEVETPTTQCYGADLKTALQRGEIGMELIDSAVSSHLRKKYELGLFENPFVDEGRVAEVFETRAQRALAREIARRSMVLLSNHAALPLPKGIQSLAVIGPAAESGRDLLGDYSYASVSELLMHTRPQGSAFDVPDMATLERHQVRIPSILEALREKLPDVRLVYARGCAHTGGDTSGFDEAVRAAQSAEMVILVLGSRSGQAPECTCGEFHDSAELKLPGLQAQLADAIFSTGKPVVVVLVNGRPLAIPEVVEKAAAVLEAWLPGEEGAAAIAEVLTGAVNPGGKLAITFPRCAGQLPTFYNHLPSAGHSYFYGDYADAPATALFPFGHGLSYTSFTYAEMNITPATASPGGEVQISLSLTNSGALAGDEVVQLYTCDEYASIPRPVKELKGFCRLRLQPGETRRITFHLPVNLLAFYDRNLDLVVEPGTIQVMVGSSSEDIRLRGTFEICGHTPAVVAERLFGCAVSVA